MAFCRGLIYLNEEKLTPRGGQNAFGYYINEELLRHGEDRVLFLTQKATTGTESDLIRWLKTFYSMFICPPKKAGKFGAYDFVHFHTTKELYMERRNLKGYHGKVLLTSHSPMPFSMEMFERLKQKSPRLASKPVLRLFQKADRFSFERADYVLFPCEDAMEPYVHHWPKFAEIIQNKASCLRFVTTGISDRKAVLSHAEICANMKIDPNTFIVSYVGRHNAVKGYDLLKKIGAQYLEMHQDCHFIVAGKEQPERGLLHPQWHEIGYTLDPYSYVAASDVFLLPNRETYFDIVAIEVLSLGKIIIASRTGGNKYYEKAGLKGVMLYDTLDEAAVLLDRVSHMTVSEKHALEQENYQFYQNRLTSEKMYESYMEMLEEVCG
ncbi:MAG: glycosyltransferase family 4 protein [Oscillospiraceae bacterium]|nr:glycosyltransferase family 4 protein [Oscillospiraceae bacterium]